MPAPPDSPGCHLAFDYGDRKIGVAVGESVTGAARPLAVVPRGAHGPDWSALDLLIAEWAPAGLVVGLPLTLEGEDQPITTRARAFARELVGRYGVPVTLHDERMTTRAAREAFAERRRIGTARRKNSAQIDALAAQLILESWLRDPGSSEFTIDPEDLHQ